MWRNTHERDHRITFDAAHHKYFIDGIECFLSSTGLVHHFFPKFDAVKVVDQYYDRWQRNNHPRYGGKTKEEILKEWDDDGDEGSTLGTQLHEAVESFYKGEKPYIDGIEEDYALFIAFQKRYPFLAPYRIEWRVGTEPDIGIAGTIDMVFMNMKDPLRRLHLADWKRTKKPITSVGFKGQMGLPPLNHLPDTNFYHYSIQLNIYKYILENYYGLTITSMHFITLHRIHQQFGMYRLGDYQKEVKQMFDIIKQQRQSLLI